jgi:heme exporter protein D
VIFNSFSEFIDMGGYGLYVWSAYGITLVVITYNIVRPVLMRRQIIRVQRRLLLQDQGIVGDREPPQALDEEGASS